MYVQAKATSWFRTILQIQLDTTGLGITSIFNFELECREDSVKLNEIEKKVKKNKGDWNEIERKKIGGKLVDKIIYNRKIKLKKKWSRWE